MKMTRFIAILMVVAFLLSFITYADGSVLGSSKVDGYTTQIGKDTYFTHNVFYSDQSGVGKQSENYIVYTANDTVTPIITNGEKLFGKASISTEANRLQKDGLTIIGGSNADYFSLQTGVPMSNAIVDGRILTKDASGQDAIGIMPDGSNFISYFTLNSILTKEDGTQIDIHNINKYRQPYAIYLMSGDFSTETQNTTEGIDVILGSINGEMKIGSELTAVVEAINEEKGSAIIPEGKLVITVDKNAPKEFYEPISTLNVGEKVSISFTADGDERWSEVVVGMGSVGGRLLIDGEVNPNLEKGAAPRTAIGIREDGSIVLYTIDGRQSGHSYGVQLTTLAKRMRELGCIDALNLDGGGSTGMVVQLPGYDNSTLINKPSDGRERMVSTFFFFANKAKKTGKIDGLHIYPKTNYVLTGATTQLEVKATDSGFYPVAIKKIDFEVEEDKNSTITSSGLFAAKDNGAVRVFVSAGEVKTFTDIVCLETPTDILVKNASDGKIVTKLDLEPESEIQLNAEAYGGQNKLVAENKNFVWQADSSIGEITDNGRFKASEIYGASGNISVSAGEKTIKIPVTLAAPRKDDEKSYNTVEIETQGEKFLITLSSEYNLKAEEEDIIVKLDGKTCEFEYDIDTGEITGELPERWGKITVFVTNTFGYTTFKTKSADIGVNMAPFEDTKGHWAEDILEYMYINKIISGDLTDGTLKFNPQKPMTRSEFAVMITNFLGIDTKSYENTDLPYSDFEEIPLWSLNSFKALFEKGILKGRYVSETESCADPIATISRAEAATIISRIIPKGFLKTKLNAPDIEEVPEWAKEGMYTLISIGTIKGYEDKSLKPLNPLTKAEAAKILYTVM